MWRPAFITITRSVIWSMKPIRCSTTTRPTHAHPGIEQVCYLLAGRALAEVGGQRAELGPGDCCFFPADMPHVFTAVGEQAVEVLVIYAPPYEEDPQRVVRVRA
ncbi:MAG: cupin domain-containing protein [Ideonella sp.]|nr:cupin domain-containing protein [Ideonella sp.]